MTDEWYKNVDEGMLTGVLAIDMTKAFDTLSQDAILQQLKNQFGVNGIPLKLFESYLSDRKTDRSISDR